MYRILIAGGDKRNIYLAGILNREIFEVSVCGFDEDVRFTNDIIVTDDIKTAASEADVIVFGLPMSHDNITVNSPYSQKCIYIADIADSAKKDAVITGGRVNSEIKEKYKCNIWDYAKRDDFAWLNAVPTAEGAIEAAMQMSSATIHGSLCMVTGFGKCAEILALTLKSMGATVHIFARSAKDLSHAEALGFKSYHLTYLSSLSKDYDMIFNSIPFGIFTSECIDNIKPSCIFTDIASAPGGISEDADKSKIKYNFLPGLPGKYSPCTAAQIIEKVILTIMRESGKDAYGWLLTKQGSGLP